MPRHCVRGVPFHVCQTEVICTLHVGKKKGKNRETWQRSKRMKGSLNKYYIFVEMPQSKRVKILHLKQNWA